MAELRAATASIPTGTIRLFPHFDDSGPVAIMDGDCVLCASGARAIARFDRERFFRIGRTQSALGAALVRHYGLEPEDPETWLYLEDGRAWSGMEAIIRIGARLGGPGRLLEICASFRVRRANGSTGGSLTTATASAALICATFPTRSCAQGCSS